MAKQTVLTKEYFDKGLKNLEKGLKVHVTKEITGMARMVASGFHENDEAHKKTQQNLNFVVDGHKNHEKRIRRIENAVGIPETI